MVQQVTKSVLSEFHIKSINITHVELQVTEAYIYNYCLSDLMFMNVRTWECNTFKLM
jgi:hypothetical protein